MILKAKHAYYKKKTSMRNSYPFFEISSRKIVIEIIKKKNKNVFSHFFKTYL